MTVFPSLLPRREDIERIDAELDRLRWYVANVSFAAAGGAGITVEQIIHALKTGEADFPGGV